MRVLFVGSHLDKGGGQALQTLQLFEELRHSVDGEYLCLRAGGTHSELLKREGVRVVGKLRLPQGVFDLRSAIRAERGSWDVVQVFDVYFGLSAAYLAGAHPRTVLFGTDPVHYVDWRYGAAARAVTRTGLEVLMRDTRLVVNSPALAEDYHRFSPVFIPNGFDLDRFDSLPTKEEARRRLGLPSEARNVLCIGNLVSAKRVERLLDANRRIPGSLLVAVGGYNEEHFGDQYYRALRTRYSDVASRAVFTGEVPHARIGLYLASADVFGFPSEFEGMPNAVMEAMGAALPIVASDIPAHRAMIRAGETGFLARDPNELAEEISALLDDPDLSSRVGERGRQHVRSNYTFAHVCGRYLELYRQMSHAE